MRSIIYLAIEGNITLDLDQASAHPRRMRMAYMLCVVLGIAAATISVGIAAEQPRRVFLLTGLTPTQAAAAETVQSFKQRLKDASSQPIEVTTDFLDLGRFDGPKADDLLVQYLSGRFAQARPDVIVPISRSAIAFVARRRDDFARGIPVVYCCTPTFAVEELRLPADIPGVVVEYDWRGTFDLARRLQPAAKVLVVVSGGSSRGLAWQKEAIGQLQPDLNNYDIRYVTSPSQAERLREVSRLPRDSVVILMPIYDQYEYGRGPSELAADIAGASSAPAYSPVPTLLGRGVVGGNMGNYGAQAAKAADLVLEILAGKAAATLPHQTKLPLQIRVDARQLERWGFSAQSLPQGASVEFAEPSLWEQHRDTVLLALLVLAVQAGIIALLLFQRYKRQTAERLLQESEATADAQRSEIAHILRVAALGELSGGIAHELGQPLSAIMFNAQAAQTLLAGKHYDKTMMVEILDDIVQQNTRASEVIQGMRRLLKKGGYKPSLVDLNDLLTSTLGLLHSELVNKRIKVEAALAKDLPPTSGDPVQLQQVLVNLIMNGIEAMASIPPAQRTLGIDTRIADDGHVKLSITNRGRGLSPDELKLIFKPYFTTKEHGLGLGLSICSTILATHGGSLTLSNAGAGGIVAVVSLPLQVRMSAAS